MYHTSTPLQMHYRVSLPPDAFSDGKLSSTSQSLVVIVEINPGDWKFCGLSGPIQRIIMNLVGNSLKYTLSGFVKVSLSQNILPQEEIEISSEASNIEIIVTDTGRGISKEFLETKLYSPFSQESTLAPGTGELHSKLAIFQC
jgi:signal transduction histidine kinase